jgi:hypothetical protein
VPQGDSHQAAVNLHHQIRRRGVDERPTVETGVELGDRLRGKFVNAYGYLPQAEVAGLQAEHLRRIVDESLQPVRFLADDRRKLVLAGAPGQLLREGAGGGLHRRQRRLELVGDRIEERGAQLAAVPRRFGPGDGILPPRSFKRDGGQVGDGLHDRVGQGLSGHRQPANGRAAKANRRDDEIRSRLEHRPLQRDLVQRGIDVGQIHSTRARNGVGVTIVERDRRQPESSGDVRGDGLRRRRRTVPQQQRTAQRVELLEVLLTRERFERSLPCAARQLAGDDGRGHEGQQRDPVLRVGDRESAHGWQEEEVQTRHRRE